MSLIPKAPAAVDPNCVFDCGGGPFVDPWEDGSAPYLAFFALAELISSGASLVGSRIGRMALLVTVTALTCFAFVWEVWNTVEMMLPVGEQNVSLLGILNAWWMYVWLPAWLIVALWLALTFWCLLGPPAAGFYAKNA